MRPAIALCLLLSSAGAHADTPAHPVESIRAAAESAVAAGPGARVVARIDHRLRLPRCTQDLTALPHAPGTVEVACPTASGWRLYVPVRVSRSGPVVVLIRPLAAGSAIPADALAVETRDLARLPATALADPVLAVGQVVRRALAAGSPLTADELRSAPVVRRGQSVILVAGGGGLEVRTSGRALADAAPGEAVAVENPSSRRVVTGVARAGGEVWVR
ncbi:MAG: flagellar basal body P-ring formation chaperone FlgA [Pseudomonadota bacterium]|jgi:flagella basal body P-ring formation protein FlgA